MNDYFLQLYVDRLTCDDIKNFATSQGISLDSKNLNIIYDYLKKYWRTFYYGNPKDILEELKNKLDAEVYVKLEKLYIEAKERFS